MKFKILRTLFLILLFINIAIGLIAVKYIIGNNARNRLHASLSTAIRKYNNGTISFINFSEITEFSWDRLYVFGPYTSCRVIQNTLGGVFWPECRYTNIEIYENINLLIFTKNGRIVQYLIYEKNIGDFAEPIKKEGYSLQESRFIIDELGRIAWAGQN